MCVFISMQTCMLCRGQTWLITNCSKRSLFLDFQSSCPPPLPSILSSFLSLVSRLCFSWVLALCELPAEWVSILGKRRRRRDSLCPDPRKLLCQTMGLFPLPRVTTPGVAPLFCHVERSSAPFLYQRSHCC